MSRPTIPPIGIKAVFKEVLRTKTGLVGLIMILVVVALALPTPFIAPYDIAKQWSNPTFWQNNPRLAAPTWVKYILGINLPETIFVKEFYKSGYVMTYGEHKVKILRLISASIKYYYDDFPSELRCILYVKYLTTPPYVTIYIERPDGIKIPIFRDYVGTGKGPVNTTIQLFISTDERSKSTIKDFLLQHGVYLKAIIPEEIVFSKNLTSKEVLKGEYRIIIEAQLSNPNDDINATFIIYGKVYGLFGTDDQRRDIALGIFWGAPVSLAFGAIAGAVTTFIQAFLGILGVVYGRKVDEFIQRLADMFLVIPVLPILILISFLYRVTIWLLLAFVIVFSILGLITKVVRPWAMQIMSEQYIEAAISYGVNKFRIAIKYVLPRMLPYIFMNISFAVPTFIFLEAALCILGLGDPVLPTWGRILEQAWDGGAIFHGYWWWIFAPAFFISWTAIGFALLGYAFDKVTNPRLREY